MSDRVPRGAHGQALSADVRALAVRAQRVMDEVCATAGAAPVRVAATGARAFASSSRSRSVAVDPGCAESLDDVLLGALLLHKLGHLQGFTSRLG